MRCGVIAGTNLSEYLRGAKEVVGMGILDERRNFYLYPKHVELGGLRARGLRPGDEADLLRHRRMDVGDAEFDGIQVRAAVGRRDALAVLQDDLPTPTHVRRDFDLADVLVEG